VVHVIASLKSAKKCEESGVEAIVAEGVQIGSRFMTSTESSAHSAFKQKILEAGEIVREIISEYQQALEQLGKL